MTGELARPSGAGRGRDASRRVRPEIWGLCDQAVVSGVNFLTVVLLARELDLAEFGYFVIAFTLLQTAGTLQAALITRPHNVLGATRVGSHYADYSTTAALAQVGFTGALVVLTAAAVSVAIAAGASQVALLLALLPALGAWQLQELGRRMLYTEGRLGAALANDVLSYGGQAVGLVVLWSAGWLNGATALLSLACAFAVGALVVRWQLGATLSGRPRVAALAENWHFGKWLGVAEIGQWFSTQFYIYLAAAVVGAVASGVLKAAQTLLGPVSVFLTFVTSYLPIVLARELEATGAIAAKVRRSLLAIIPGVVVYCAVMAVFAEPVLGAVYGTDYEGYAAVVQLFALYYVLLTLSTVAIAALSARGQTHSVFVGQAAGAVLSLAFGWLLLDLYGAEGGVVGMLVSWVAAMALFARALWARPDALPEASGELSDERRRLDPTVGR